MTADGHFAVHVSKHCFRAIAFCSSQSIPFVQAGIQLELRMERKNLFFGRHRKVLSACCKNTVVVTDICMHIMRSRRQCCSGIHNDVHNSSNPIVVRQIRFVTKDGICNIPDILITLSRKMNF